MNSYFERTWKETAGFRIPVFAWRHWKKNHGDTWIFIAGLSPEVELKPLSTWQKRCYWLTCAACTSLQTFALRARLRFSFVSRSRRTVGLLYQLIKTDSEPCEQSLSSRNAAMLRLSLLLPGSDHLSVRLVPSLTLPNTAAILTALCPQNAVITSAYNKRQIISVNNISGWSL